MNYKNKEKIKINDTEIELYYESNTVRVSNIKRFLLTDSFFEDLFLKVDFVIKKIVFSKVIFFKIEIYNFREYKIDFYFNDCSFVQEITFGKTEGIRREEYYKEPQNNDQLNSISFFAPRFEGNINFKICTSLKKLDFGKSEGNFVHRTNYDLSKINLKIGSLIGDQIDFYPKIKEIYINTIKMDLFECYFCETNSLIIRQSSIDEITISHTKIKNEFIIFHNNNKIQKTFPSSFQFLRIYDSNIKKVNIFNTEIAHKEVSFLKRKNSEIVIDGGKLEEFHFSNSLEKYEINLGSFKVQDVEINKSFVFTSSIFMKVDNIRFNKIKLPEKTSFQINSIKANYIGIGDFHVYESAFVKFNFISINKELVLIFNSFSKHTSFQSCDFSKAKYKTIKTSSFKDAIFNNVSWGDISIIEANRDTFRQLKLAYSSQQNLIQANQFYAEEMKKYKEELFDPKSEIKHSSQEKILFWINEKLSNFGQDWILPILWFIALTISFLIGIDTTKTTIENGFIENLDYFVTIYLSFSCLIFCFSIRIKTLLFLFIVISITFFNIELNQFATFINPNPKFYKYFENYSFVWTLHKFLMIPIGWSLITAIKRNVKLDG